jgi:hypothetical protein
LFSDINTFYDEDQGLTDTRPIEKTCISPRISRKGLGRMERRKGNRMIQGVENQETISLARKPIARSVNIAKAPNTATLRSLRFKADVQYSS